MQNVRYTHLFGLVGLILLLGCGHFPFSESRQGSEPSIEAATP